MSEKKGKTELSPEAQMELTAFIAQTNDLQRKKDRNLMLTGAALGSALTLVGVVGLAYLLSESVDDDE